MKTLKPGNVFPLIIAGLIGVCSFCNAEIELDSNDSPAKGRVLLEPEGDVAVLIQQCDCGKHVMVRAIPRDTETPAQFAKRAENAVRDGRFWILPSDISVAKEEGEKIGKVIKAASKKAEKE